PPPFSLECATPKTAPRHRAATRARLQSDCEPARRPHQFRGNWSKYTTFVAGEGRAHVQAPASRNRRRVAIDLAARGSGQEEGERGIGERGRGGLHAEVTCRRSEKERSGDVARGFEE